MYRVTSVSPLGATMITFHNTLYFANAERLARKLAGHANVSDPEAVNAAPDLTEAACQHGARNKPQRRAERGMGLGNPMSGG